MVSDAMVEAATNAILTAFKTDNSDLRDLSEDDKMLAIASGLAKAALEAALSSAQAPDGYRLVPIEPTDEMLARVAAIIEHEFNRKPPAFCLHLWEHFLAAAPQPPAGKQ